MTYALANTTLSVAQIAADPELRFVRVPCFIPGPHRPPEDPTALEFFASSVGEPPAGHVVGFEARNDSNVMRARGCRFVSDLNVLLANSCISSSVVTRRSSPGSVIETLALPVDGWEGGKSCEHLQLEDMRRSSTIWNRTIQMSCRGEADNSRLHVDVKIQRLEGRPNLHFLFMAPSASRGQGPDTANYLCLLAANLRKRGMWVGEHHLFPGGTIWLRLL